MNFRFPLIVLSVLGCLLISGGPLGASAATADEAAATAVRTVPDLAYKSGDSLSDYEKSRCQLDLYLPPSAKGVPAIVWLHGGGITGGSKSDGGTARVARFFAGKGIAMAAINYRLSPQATYPAYLDDTAAAFAWVKTHATEYGIDPAKVFLGGHSAGAYLAAMVGIDDRWLKPYQLAPDAIAGLIPVSGQIMTHFTIRAERGIKDQNVITADEAAPINHLRKDTPPWLILFGDKDWPGRREELLYFISMMKVVGNQKVQYQQIDDRTHGSIVGKMPEPGDPGAAAIIRFVTGQ